MKLRRMVGIWGIARRPASRALQSIVAITTMTVAATGQTFPLSVQGKLTGVPDGQQSMTLKIWDTASGGNEVASVPFEAEVNGGVFSSVIDTPTSAFTGAGRWWSVIHGSEITHRQRVGMSPLAFATEYLLKGARSNEWLYLGPLQDESIGNYPNYGALLWFDGGWSTSGTRNGTQLWIARHNRSQAITSLRMNIGQGGNSDKRFEIGYSPTGEPDSFDRVLTVDMRGNLSAEGNGAFDGNVSARVLTIIGGSDLAEPFAASADSKTEAKPGMVMSIDPDNPGTLRVASRAYDTRVAGVYSGGNGLNTGMIMGQEGCELTSPGENKVPVAMTGRVWVYADESGGEIRPGDRLTTSGTKPGHAMKVTDDTRSIGTVIGKAMTAVDPDSGMVMVLVNLQ